MTFTRQMVSLKNKVKVLYRDLPLKPRRPPPPPPPPRPPPPPPPPLRGGPSRPHLVFPFEGSTLTLLPLMRLKQKTPCLFTV